MRQSTAAPCRRLLAALVSLVVCLPVAIAQTAIAQTALAQTAAFPARTITITVPYTAGGPTDVIARILADHMGRTLGQSIVIDNAAGAGGSIAPDKVAKAAPDGYTLLIHHIALLAAPSLYGNLHYDTATAFAPIGLVNTGPLVLVTRNSLPVTTPQNLFAWIKANGEKVTAGHAGAGSNSHLCEVMLARVLGTKMTYVGYRGAAPALNDLMSGQIDLICDQTTNSVPQILAHNVKAFAVTSKDRNGAIPDVPTMAELGMPGMQFTVWHGLYAPKGTPQTVISTLNAALAKALDDPAVQAKFAALGTVVFANSERSPEAHAALFASDLARITQLIVDAGLKLGQEK